ncbi:MAG: NfeD family protein [Longimonas sp.]|uniref:NfeD family protein n=1 Tax=Longimonas sp. TaxID=2039626 RepID=UPI0033503F2C
MDADLLTWTFFLGGFLLMVLELLIPGGIAFFLGVGGILTGLLTLTGLISDPLGAALVWLFTSTALTIALRPIAMRYFGGDFSLAMTNEDAEAMGQVVHVVEETGDDDPGRIRFRGATWDARTTEGRLPKGAKARILYRDNLTWVIEPVDHAALDEEFSDALNESERSSESASSTNGSSSSDTPPRSRDSSRSS